MTYDSLNIPETYVPSLSQQTRSPGKKTMPDMLDTNIFCVVIDVYYCNTWNNKWMNSP